MHNCNINYNRLALRSDKSMSEAFRPAGYQKYIPSGNSYTSAKIGHSFFDGSQQATAMIP